MSIHICANCHYRQRPCAGSCVCLVDNRPLQDHVANNDCPKGLFSLVRRPPERIPDDFDPSQEKLRMQHGGCCGSPSRRAS